MENENKVVETKVEVAPTEAPKEEAKAVVANKEDSNANGEKKPFNKKFNRRGDRGFRGPRVKEFDENVVNISRVTKVVKGGKRIKFQALVVIGDHKGKYGYGIGKSGEVPDAIKKAVDAARKNMYTLNIVRGDTISHDIIGKFGATHVFLKPAKPGTGIVAGGPVRAILELAGIKNVYSKVHGSRTAINIIRATDDALRNLKTYTHTQELRNK